MKSKWKQMIVPIVVSAIFIAYFIVYFTVLITLLDGVFKWLLGVLPLLFSLVMVKVCVERIKEIKKGENDDLSQY